MARRAWEEVKRMIADPGRAMVVADELNIVLRSDYLPLDEVVAALKAKPAMTHVIVTGRQEPAALVEIADLVIALALSKHPFRADVNHKAGIEFSGKNPDSTLVRIRTQP